MYEKIVFVPENKSLKESLKAEGKAKICLTNKCKQLKINKSNVSIIQDNMSSLKRKQKEELNQENTKLQVTIIKLHYVH